MTLVLPNQRNLNAATKSSTPLAREDQVKALIKMQHDIRTPMHVVKGLTAILATSTPLSPRQKEIVAALSSGEEQLCALIDQMLDFIQMTIDNKDTPFISRPSLLQENKLDKRPSL